MNVDIKCYCEHKNQDYPKNNILCGDGNNQTYFKPAGSCDMDETCVGPENWSDAICMTFRSKLTQLILAADNFLNSSCQDSSHFKKKYYLPKV